MKIVLSGGCAELVEKKSRFIASVFPISSQEETGKALAQVRKTYWDARHSCHAYVIGPKNEISHSSDDGEPQGTAGKPILQVLTGSQVHNCMIIVTRYFGGVLLGTGGLVRAYGAAAKAGLEASRIGLEKTGTLLSFSVSYDLLGKVRYLAAASSLTVTDLTYTDVCQFAILVPEGRLETFRADLTEKTAGKLVLLSETPVSYVQGESGEILEMAPSGRQAS